MDTFSLPVSMVFSTPGYICESSVNVCLDVALQHFGSRPYECVYIPTWGFLQHLASFSAMGKASQGSASILDV